MKKWLKYIIITVLVFAGVNNVKAEEINFCTYKYSSTFKGTEASSNVKNTFLYAIADRVAPDTTFENFAYFKGNSIQSVNNCPKNFCVVSDTKAIQSPDYQLIDLNFSSYNYFYAGECKESYDKGDSLYQFTISNEAPQATKKICLETLGESKNTCMTISYNNGVIEYNADNLVSSKDSGNRKINVQFDENSLKYAYDPETNIFKEAYCEVDSATNNSINIKVYFYEHGGSEHCSAVNFSTGVKDENENFAPIDGCDSLGETGSLIRRIYTLLKFLIPILVIALSIVDFIKVVVSGDEKAYKNAWNKFIKRIIIGVVILILPALLSLVIRISGVLEGTGQNNEQNIFCILK